jgi:hypothetical protein
VVAEVEPDPVTRFRCPACGGPRIPNVAGPKPGSDALDHLRSARSARSSQLAWRAGSITTGSFGVLATLIMLAVFSIVHPPLIPLIAGLILCAAPFAFAVIGWQKAGKRMAEFKRELDEAWQLAARDLVRNRGLMPATELAEVMRIDHAQAEKIMVRLASLDELRSEMTDSGDLAISVRGGARVRVAPAVDLPKPDAEPVRVAAAVEGEVVEHPVAEDSKDRSGKVGA